MDLSSGKTTASTHISDTQRDVADYAVTGLNIVISQMGGRSPAAHLAENIRQDFRQLPYDAAAQSRVGDEGWNRLQELQRTIVDTPGLPQEQAFNLLAVMAGVVSAVSTAGLVKTPERETERAIAGETNPAQAAGDASSQGESTRWRRYIAAPRSTSQRGGERSGPP